MEDDEIVHIAVCKHLKEQVGLDDTKTVCGIPLYRLWNKKQYGYHMDDESDRKIKIPNTDIVLDFRDHEDIDKLKDICPKCKKKVLTLRLKWLVEHGGKK